jgi:Major Facilitator Superfamily
VVLDKGQEDDWFGSRFITRLVIISVVCLVGLVIWEWRHKAPIIDVHLFKNFNFATANVMMFIFGVLLFGALVTMPQFLQTVLGYTAENAGLVLSGGGAVVLALMPIVGMLAGKYPAKYIIAAGWLALAIGMYVSTVQLDTLISFQSATVLRLIQSVGLGLLFVPVTMAGYIRMPAEKANSVAGIINFMAQHRQQRGDVHGHDGVGAARASSPGGAVAVYHSVRSVCSEPGQSFEPATGALRIERCRRAQTGLRSALSSYGRTGRDTRLHRYFLGADHRGKHNVSAFVHRSQKRSQGQWRYGCGLAKLFYGGL